MLHDRLKYYFQMRCKNLIVPERYGLFTAIIIHIGEELVCMVGKISYIAQWYIYKLLIYCC